MNLKEQLNFYGEKKEPFFFIINYDKSKYEKSPYDLAVENSRFEAEEIFNRLKNDQSYQSRLKSNPLTLAIIMSEFDKADSYIDIYDVNNRDIFGNTPIFYAIMNNDQYLVKRLLDNNANIEQIDASNDDAIYYATLVNNKEIIKHILKLKVDLNKKYGGYTVKEYSLYNKNVEVYDILNQKK